MRVIESATDTEVAAVKRIISHISARTAHKLCARIESGAAKIKALELERDTIQEYADQVGANLTAAEGTLKERDEQIAALRRDFVDSCPCPQCPTEAEKRRTVSPGRIALLADVARLERLIVAEHDTSLDSWECCGDEESHAEARAIKARKA